MTQKHPARPHHNQTLRHRTRYPVRGSCLAGTTTRARARLAQNNLIRAPPLTRRRAATREQIESAHVRRERGKSLKAALSLSVIRPAE
jgi:hypothetical protein